MSTVVTRSADGATRHRQAGAAVTVSHVGKTFKLPNEQFYTLKEHVLHPMRSQAHDLLEALDDVTIEVAEGEFFGIVGRNGSGKSTLLKCIAGIYRADRGSITVRGRISPFIELGVGFSPELTARDNVMINAVMLGLTRRQARERFDAIIDFAEMHDFLDLRLKNYSSGMLVRLAFSAAIQVETEVLLVDEVLAVGDADFQQKCFDQFKRLKREGRTIIFVTHDMSAIERFCDRAMLLHKGHMVEIGDPAPVARRYNQLNFGNATNSAPAARELGSRSAEIVDGWFEDPGGVRTAESGFGDQCTVAVEVEFHESIENPIFGVALHNDAGANVFATNSDRDHSDSGTFQAGSRAVYRMRFDNWLAPSRYSLTATVARPGLGANAVAFKEDLASVIVHSGPQTSSVVALPHTFEIDRE